jgi:hypothetical protein
MDDNKIKTTPLKTLGDPVELGDPVYLKHNGGLYLSFAESDVSGYYPTLGKVPVVLRFEPTFATSDLMIEDGQKVKIRTSENLVPELKKPISSEAAIRNNLHASKAKFDWEPGAKCFYYSTGGQKEFSEQHWFLMRDRLKEGVLKFGDEVYIQSADRKYLKNRLTKIGNYLTLKEGAQECWTIEPAPVR